LGLGPGGGLDLTDGLELLGDGRACQE
jgi:hypothetical protein